MAKPIILRYEWLGTMGRAAACYVGRPGEVAEQRAAVETDLRRVETEIGRLVDALASGGGLASVREAIQTREQRRADLRAHLEHLDGLARAPRLDPGRLKGELNERLTAWRALLDDEAVKARQIVSKLLDGRLVFEPDPEKGVYTFSGKASYGRLLSGVVGQKVWCPRGGSSTLGRCHSRGRSARRNLSSLPGVRGGTLERARARTG